MPVASDLLLNLRRVQYVSVPEALLTALAWRVLMPSTERATPVGLVYQLSSRSPSGRKLAYVETRPRERELQEFAGALVESGLQTETQDLVLGRAVTNGLEGVRATKGGRQAAVPMTPALALMQNMAGLQGSSNPPALGALIEQMYALGDIDERQSTAAGLWFEAARHRCVVDPMARAIDEALTKVVHGPIAPVEPSPEMPVSNRGLFPRSPFEWFARSWPQICSYEWVEALPARVWVDWASTVLRLAVGCGALWEAAWFDGVARTIVLGKEVQSWDQLRRDMPEVLPWKASGTTPTIRDVASTLKWRVHRSERVRGLLTGWIGVTQEPGRPSRGSIEAVRAVNMMKEDRALCESLAEALGEQAEAPGANNRWEAIRYALKVREVAGDNADYYGLLTASGRYLYPDPGAEWVAAVGSLACGGPGRIATVGDLQWDLAALGMQPEVSDLIGHLERAGIAKGSADADLGVEIHAAFGRPE